MKFENIKYMNKVLTVVVFLLMSIGAWAGEVIIVKNPSTGGTVTASAVTLGQTCTLTVKPASGYYLKSIKAMTTVDGSAIQAPGRRTGIDIDETELTISSDATADPSGETTHTFTMPTDENLNVEVTAKFESRISISDAIVTLATSEFTYDGTAKEPAVSSVKLGTTTLNTNEYSVSYSNNVNVSAAASPTVTITGQRQYMGTATATFTITAKSITSDMITLSVSSFVYNGESQLPTVTVNDGTTQLAENEDFTISYQKLNGETAVEADDTKDVATYNVVVTGKGNYEGSATKSFDITRAPLENLSVSLTGWTYGNMPKVISPSVAGNAGEGTKTYYYKVKDADDNTYTSVVPENAGIYTIKVEVAETANYASGSATGDFTIDKAPLTEGLTVNITGWKYGATPNTPSVEGNLGNGTVTYTYKDAEDEEAEFSTTVPTNVGSYLIKATVAETANYLTGQAENEFSIERGDLSMVRDSIPEELVYDGNAHQLIFVKNVPEGATVKYHFESISKDNYEDGSFALLCEPLTEAYVTTVPSSTDAGYFALFYMVDGGDNYNDKAAGAMKKVAIYPAEITEMTLSATSLPYNGSDQTVTITSVKAGDLVLTADDYTVTLNEEVVEDAINAKEVGEYTVVVTGQGNFTGTESATFSITNRTLAANEVTFYDHWATYFSADGDVELPEGIGAFVATGVGDGVVTVSQIKYVPEAVAVLLNDETATAGTVAFDPEEDTNLLQHAFEDFEVGEDLIYGLYNGTFMRVTGTIPAGKNYLSPYYDGPVAPRLNIVIDGEENTTSVNGVRSNMAEERGDYYDLSGRKLSNMPSKNGLYIKNGRKVVVNK